MEEVQVDLYWIYTAGFLVFIPAGGGRVASRLPTDLDENDAKWKRNQVRKIKFYLHEVPQVNYKSSLQSGDIYPLILIANLETTHVVL
jgi:hypothetical protein